MRAQRAKRKQGTQTNTKPTRAKSQISARKRSFAEFFVAPHFGETKRGLPAGSDQRERAGSALLGATAGSGQLAPSRASRGAQNGARLSPQPTPRAKRTLAGFGGGAGARARRNEATAHGAGSGGRVACGTTPRTVAGKGVRRYDERRSEPLTASPEAGSGEHDEHLWGAGGLWSFAEQPARGGKLRLAESNGANGNAGGKGGLCLRRATEQGKRSGGNHAPSGEKTQRTQNKHKTN